MQGQTRFFEVIDERGYLLQDNHNRFFGGLYGGIGLFLILAATNPQRYRQGLNLMFFLTFMGGLARFTALRPDVIFGPAIVGSLIVELVLMPILFVWLARSLPGPVAGAYD